MSVSARPQNWVSMKKWVHAMTLILLPACKIMFGYSSSTELGSPTTANFCFFRWKMTNILSDSNWNQCTYFFHLFPSLDLTVRATAHQKTWYFKENSQKNQKMVNQERWKQLLMKCKGIMYRCRVFYLYSTFKLIYNKENFI